MTTNFKLFTGKNGDLVAIDPSNVTAVTIGRHTETKAVVSIDVLLDTHLVELCPDNHNLADVIDTLEETT